jgi:hypothetical protein
MIALEAADKLLRYILARVKVNHPKAGLVVILVTTRDNLRLLTTITRSLDRHLTSSTKSRMARSVVNMLTTS